MRAEHQGMSVNLFEGKGEIRALLRSRDWSQTPLGAVETWSEDLRTAVQCLLTEIEQAQPLEKSQLALVQSPQNDAQTVATCQIDSFQVTLFDALRWLTNANEIQATAARILGESLGASRIIYVEVLPGGHEVIVHTNYTNSVAELSGRYRLEDFGRNLTDDHRAGRTAIVPDVGNSLKYTETAKAMYRELDIAAHVDVPLIKNDQFVALLAVHQATPRDWTDLEVRRIEETAERTWAAVERACVEAALRESEAKYRTLFDSIDEGFCTIEVLFNADGTPFDHRILQANPAFARQSGLANPEGKTASELAPGVEQFWNDLYAQVIRTGESIRTEIRSDALDRWFDVLVSRVGDAATCRVAVVFTDISERKRAEASLQQTSEELERQLRKFDAIAAAIPDFIYTFDLVGQFTFVNRPLLDLWQKTLAEALGKTFFELGYPADLAARLQDQIQQVIETRQPLKDEAPYTSAVRTGVYEYVFVPLLDAKGAVEAVAGVTRDITDRKHTEAALRASENRLRLALESAELGTWDFNPMTGVLQWDEQCKAMFGLAPEAAVNYEIFLSGLHPDDRDRTDQVVQAALKPESGGEYDIEYRTIGIEDGVERWIAAKGKAFFNSARLAIRFIGTVLNMTESKRAEAERERLLHREQAARETAERANRVKDEFLAVLSHELRSPLNPILGWTRLLQNGKLDPSRQSAALNTIERNAKLQAQLIEDLLDISRIMQGKLILTATPVSLPFVVSAAIETVQLAAEAKQIAILLDLDASLQPIFGDAARLQQVVWNLLTNAVKFTPHGGQVTIALRQHAQHAQLRVKDTGKGIQPQFLPYVFEYFRQEDGSTTRKFGGLGLGLAIARQIVELHGGTVAAESDGENQGATFIVQLPTMPQAAALLSEPTPTQIESKTPLATLQILLVDDDTDTREFQAFLLQQNGATVTAVDSGLAALQVLGQLTPDVIVSDVGMADMDGYGLMQQIRSRPADRGGKIPAIALTAYAAEVDQQKALQAGFQLHLTKPLEPEQLVSAIVSLLQPNQL